jgi:hypothetical protein
MALTDEELQALALRYTGLLMVDKKAREEVSSFPKHREHPEEYHRRLAEFVNNRLQPAAPLETEEAARLHKHVNDAVEPLRDNLKAHTANEHEYMMAWDGLEGLNCP